MLREEFMVKKMQEYGDREKLKEISFKCRGRSRSRVSGSYTDEVINFKDPAGGR